MAAIDGIIHLLVVNYEENLQRILQNNRVQRHLRDASNPFYLPDRLFLKMFRLNKETAFDFIEDVRGRLAQPLKATKVPAHLRILIALHFFGHGSYQTGAGLSHPLAVSQPVVSRCITEVSDVITRFLLNTWIKWPHTYQEKNSVKEGFQIMEPRMRNILGIIDCTQIKIIAPPHDHAVYLTGPYYCRKGYYSINTQIITDANRVIRSINGRFPGSVHDSAIWSMSGIKRILQNNFLQHNGDDYLIGDSGYPLEPWLLVPYPHVVPDSEEARFNTSLSSVRTIIEHVNGLLKSRFRCVHEHRALHYDPLRAAKIIYSCAVLHNICRHRNVPEPPDDECPPVVPIGDNQERQLPGNNEWYRLGARVRQNIVNNYFQN